MWIQKFTKKLRRKVLQREKIKGYLGFAIKGRKILFGLDNIEEYKKTIYLIIIGNNLTEKNENKMRKLATRLNCALIKLDENFGDLIERPTCKLCALTDINLSKGIIALNEGIIFKGDI